ncbi:MAG: insulinase family protein, partial [Candidatus Pacebacteria bacterium]|nr:insulinase family protein [Candidatus Paceibacterota bacterium]
VVDLAMEVIDRLLLGSSGAPLYKALVESRLGSDLTASGYNNGMLQTTFHVGLKGVRCENKQAVCDLIDSVLHDVIDSGFSEEQVRTAFHQLQYSHREIQSRFPLRLMSWVYNAWLYECDPLTYIRTGEYLDSLQADYRQDKDLFCRLIRQRFLENPHRLELTFHPDPQLEAVRAEQEARELQVLREQMTPEDLERIQREARELVEHQSTPNSPENIDSLPQLHISDVPEIPQPLPCQVDTLGEELLFVRSEIPSNGVNYLYLAFNLAGLPDELIDYVPVFCQLLTRVGAAGHSYADIAQKIAGNTGGLKAETVIGADALDPGRLLWYLTISTKALTTTYTEALHIIRDLLFELDLTDTARIRDVLRQTRERCISDIIPAGHRFAARHAARTLSPAGALGERWSGLPQVRLIVKLADHNEYMMDHLRDKLERIRKCLLNRRRIKVSFTGDLPLEHKTKEWVQQLAHDMADEAIPEGVPAIDSGGASPLNEGLALMADVAYCARCFPAPHASQPDAPCVHLLSHLLSFDYLWEEVRIKGGA